MNATKNKSPLRYPGGKTRACNKLGSILLEHFDVKSFEQLVSPFFGGGSFEFHVQNKYGLSIVANDKFAPLYNFWHTCKAATVDKKNLCVEITKRVNMVN